MRTYDQIPEQLPHFHATDAGPLMSAPRAAPQALGTAVLALLTVLTCGGLGGRAGESGESHSCRAIVTGLTDTYSPRRERKLAFGPGDWPGVAFGQGACVNLCNMSRGIWPCDAGSKLTVNAIYCIKNLYAPVTPCSLWAANC